MDQDALPMPGLDSLAVVFASGDCWADMMTVVETTGRRRLVSTSCERLLGCPQQALLGIPIFSHSVPEDVSRWREAVRVTAETGGTRLIETKERHEDGSWRFFESHLSQLPLAEGRLVMVVSRDVTAQRSERNRLRESETFLRSLLDHLPLSILRKDLHGRFTYVNLHFAAIVGCPPDQIVGRTDADFYPAELVQKFREDDARTIACGQPVEQVETSRAANGRETRVQVLKTPLRDSRGNVSGLQVVFWDITDRQLAQEAMVRSFREAENLLASISAALIGVNPEGQVCRWNRGAENLFALEQKEALGRSWLDFDLGWDWSQVRQAVIDCLLQQKPVQLVDVACKPNGRSERTLHLTFSPNLEGLGENGLQYTVLATDLTERRILETQLRQAQRLESIGQLSAGIAHEINSPTQFIADSLLFISESFERLKPALGGLQKLAEGNQAGAPSDSSPTSLLASLPDDLDLLLEDIPDSLRRATDGVGRISGIVTAMKTFSHPDVGTMAPTCLQKAIESTITVARNEWKYVADVSMEFAPDLPPVPCFPGDLNQVILNLVVNAAHAISESKGFREGRKGRITISTARIGDCAEIRVQDNGTGIPEAVRHRIFEPFFTTKEVGRGTGQGLFIAHRIVTEKHRGSLTFETRLGEGTTFAVQIPLIPSKCQKSNN